MDLFGDLQTAFWKPFVVQDVLGSLNLLSGRKFLSLDSQFTSVPAPSYQGVT